MSPYESWIEHFHCSSYQELYSKITIIATSKMGLDKVPFTLSDLEHPSSDKTCPEIYSFMEQCCRVYIGDNSEVEIIDMIRYLKDNPPAESYENPEVSDAEATRDEKNLMNHIFAYGIDLPGSKHNLYGHLQYFSEFFIDMFFGNYTEFMEHVNRLSKKELQKALRKREGYCQFSPIFAPILGIRLIDLQNNTNYTSQEKLKVRTLYSGCNENKHHQILTKLIELGADVNANDIFGITPLHYAVLYRDEEMIIELLKNGADPYAKCRMTVSVFYLLLYMICFGSESSNEHQIKIIKNYFYKHVAKRHGKYFIQFTFLIICWWYNGCLLKGISLLNAVLGIKYFWKYLVRWWKTNSYEPSRHAKFKKSRYQMQTSTVKSQPQKNSSKTKTKRSNCHKNNEVD